MPFAATQMDLEIFMLSKVSQEKKKCRMTSLMYGINDTNELTKQKETHRLREQTCSC